MPIMFHIETTTSTTTTTTSGESVLNLGYLRSYQGILKVAEVVVLLIAFLCVYCTLGWTRFSPLCFFEVVTLWFHISFLIFLAMHCFNLHSKVPCINWPVTEFLHYTLGALLIFIASIVAAVNSFGYSPLVAGTVFGFIASFLMLISLWSSYNITCGSQPRGVNV